MTRPRMEPRSPGPLANTLPTRPMMQVYCILEAGLNNHLRAHDRDLVINQDGWSIILVVKTSTIN